MVFPDWPAFDKWALTWKSSIFWSLFYIGYYILFATHWWMYLLIPVHILISPVHGTIVNWFAHKYGYTNFKMNNTSKNLLPVDFLMPGESYHNNHHKYPSSINFGGVRWHELDPVYPVIRFLEWLGGNKTKGPVTQTGRGGILASASKEFSRSPLVSSPLTLII